MNKLKRPEGEEQGRQCGWQIVTKEEVVGSESDRKWRTGSVWVSFTLGDVENLRVF